MKPRKLVLYRETVQRLDAENLREARGGAAPGVATIPAAGVGRDTRPVPFRTTDDYSWCIFCG